MAGGSSTAKPTRYGVVAQVPSGDSVVVREITDSRQTKDITISLSYVRAPKLAKPSPKTSPDEAYAWEAREFLRKKLIGKKVSFVITSGAWKEIFGKIYLQTTDSDLEDVIVSGIDAGFLEVTTGQKGDYIEKLISLQSQARDAKRGRWSQDGQRHIRDIIWNSTSSTLFAKHSRKHVNAVIESVQHGDLVYAILLPSFERVMVQLSGIVIVSEFKEKATTYVTDRMVHRDVTIVLEFLIQDYLMGSVYHHLHGNIAVYLVLEGYAKCSASILIDTSPQGNSFRKAELSAKEKHCGVWRDENVPCSEAAVSPIAKQPEQFLYKGRIYQTERELVEALILDGYAKVSQGLTCGGNFYEDMHRLVQSRIEDGVVTKHGHWMEITVIFVIGLKNIYGIGL